MADQNITALPVATTPESSDQILLVGATEEKLIDYDKLADAILGKIASKNFALDQGNKTLLQALNELNSNLWKTKNITFSDITIPSQGYIRYDEMTYNSKIPKNILFATVFSYGTMDPNYPFTAGTAYIFGVPGCVISNTVITFAFKE